MAVLGAVLAAGWFDSGAGATAEVRGGQLSRRIPAKEVIRNRFEQWLIRLFAGFVLAIALLGTTVESLSVRELDIATVVILLMVGVLEWYSWRFAVRVCVVVSRDEVKIVNLLRVYRIPMDLVDGAGTGPGVIGVVLKDGRGLAAMAMAPSLLGAITGIDRRRSERFDAAVKRAQRRRSRSRGRDVVTRWQPELWVFLVVVGILFGLLLFG